MADKDASEEKKEPRKYPKTGVDFNRAQLERLLKNPDKPVVLPEPPKEKTIRPPKDMVKNVQGSSAGAGSGEFHVYKASRRREYERIKLMEDEKAKEEMEAVTERRKREREEEAEAKTAKNRAKRQKRKEAARQKGKGKPKGDVPERKEQAGGGDSESDDGRPGPDVPFKKKRLVAPEVISVAKAPSEDEDEEMAPTSAPAASTVKANVTIHDED
ncbi:SubName: Full=Uncharacterized protein {ECO:0000313/EMBL:CCA70552.1} [Serendipita indica DSM 11827]|uniref:DUF1168-domain-containing protein n=1 Tax=Serendipita indica (strain DSM 11827) TaxID=1109443 RepID=G4TGW4_SERID|nr:SubName: Full=Uncharacterized protein {ECO:0000313/EMBL:CCA70552.1} [Serendipita indica DSM 11827]CCA70552.1 hypothetical protein PIIN_04489 [Serendipita indica DSM 11827]